MSQASVRFARSALFPVLVLPSATLLLDAQERQPTLGDALTRLEGQLERGETSSNIETESGICPVCSTI